MPDPFRVIEAIDADDERAAGQALEHVPDERQSLRRWARWAKAAVSMPTGKTSTRIVRSATVKLKSWLCRPHSRVRERLKLKASSPVWKPTRSYSQSDGMRRSWCGSAVSISGGGHGM